jgi:hypothetical protein
MNNRYSYLLETINKRQCKKCIEIGVWKGDLSFYLCESSPAIKEYYMVDPLLYSDNAFDHSDDDHPTIMKQGRYECAMGGKVRNQNELDSMALNIEQKTKKFQNLKFIRKSSLEASLDFEDSYFDFIYLDAIHLYKHVKEDIINWLPKLKNKGIFIGDDCNNMFPGVEKAAKEVLGSNVYFNKPLSQWIYIKE